MNKRLLILRMLFVPLLESLQETGLDCAFWNFSYKIGVVLCIPFQQFGFIAYENEEGKNLFFHMSEVEGEVELQVSS